MRTSVRSPGKTELQNDGSAARAARCSTVSSRSTSAISAGLVLSIWPIITKDRAHIGLNKGTRQAADRARPAETSRLVSASNRRSSSPLLLARSCLTRDRRFWR